MAASPTPSATDTAPIILVGNPNVGKSALFGRLTGTYVTVSNYPGTTVDLISGVAHLEDGRHTLTDTPGVNNLLPTSEDEQVTRDILMNGGQDDLVVQVADAKNLRRGLFITLQLAEMGIPFLLALNMDDEARKRGIAVDALKLSGLLGIPVRTTVATKGTGIDDLRAALPKACKSGFALQYDPDIEEAVTEIVSLLPETGISRRSLALMLLAGDDSLDGWLAANVALESRRSIRVVRDRLEEMFPEGVGYQINRERLATADALLNETVRQSAPSGSSYAQKLGRLTTHPVWGLPILAGVLWLVYQFVGIWGAGTLVGLMEETLFGEYLNPFATRLVETLIPITLVQEFLVGEFGLITMALTYAIALVLPIVTTFFIAFGILEDSGYLPRLAVMADRVFKAMGLNGKAVLPMILGLGCDTMATLTTRVLESKKERVVVTLLLSLGVPCSAQLAVIFAMLATLPLGAQAIWWGTIMMTIFLVGWAASKVLPGETSDFVLELPPLRLPQPKNILIKTMARIEWYLKEAVPLFVIGTIILFVGAKTGLLELIQRAASPVVNGLLNLPTEAANMFVIGFLRRDFGATGFWEMSKEGRLDTIQVVVSLIAITLFMPCIAQFFVTIRERGIKTAMGIAGFTLTFSIGVAALINFVLRHFNVQF